MKFVRFIGDDGVGIGVVDGDVHRVIPGYDDLLPLVQQGEDALLSAGDEALRCGAAIRAERTAALSPIATPPTFRDFYAFEQHVKAGRAWRGLEMDPLWYELPVFYFSNPYAFRGDGDVPMTPTAERFDFELEVAAILGKGGSDLTPEEGEDCVIAYAVLNDWSGRDVQRKEMLLSMGPVKGKDTATSLGPWLVTKDELETYRTTTGFDRTMTCSVNGVEYSRANWSDVHYSFGEMVAYASRGTEVRAGDVIGSGTCGTGCINELSQTYGVDRFPFLKPGDEVVASIEGLGSLRSTIVAAHEPVSYRSER
ncbi:fumarylacetoacetate hydrolase family protein [Microbacterium ulmi]|uniref:Fumarylacetoacetate hydrolase family protein n=1 Tax=Microbacterium ulmi TaxID=179095 RepID=A0A7Y2M2L2_9MICO|nr:fumarylacetoacetate hydrolase family protein [Microbacterium ulmi]NII68965.1 2-keto-4-pentenoate hydratase/2-oxohepta-3-ene-1,7-dioic acid hydratase in catechol pathway [Microbacterium ulmi]NNH03948.1 fumarylacetoacetate hydrolase family protein [Microbacterium ulmi]